MIGITLENLDKAAYLLKDMPSQCRTAGNVAVNRTLLHIRKEIASRVHKTYWIKSGDVKQSLGVRRAQGRERKGVVTSKGHRLLLSAFRITGGEDKPLKVAVKRGGASKEFKGLFKGTTKSGFTGYLAREKGSKNAYPLSVPTGLSIPEMIGSHVVVDSLMEEASKFLNDRFTQEVNFRAARGLTGLKGKWQNS